MTKIVTGNTGKAVIWMSTLPFKNNSIEWDNNYMLYASREEVQDGVRIQKLSEAKANDHVVYDFEAAMFRSDGASKCVGLNEYAVHNRMKQYDCLTFGLAQEVVVNGQTRPGNPINALTLPYNHKAVMQFAEGELEKSIAYDYEKGRLMLTEQ